jgi:hypothetical protein
VVLSFVEDVKDWSDVYEEVNPDAALEVFVKLFISCIDKHAPVMKLTVRTVQAPWNDYELKHFMVQRNDAKKKHKKRKTSQTAQLIG